MPGLAAHVAAVPDPRDQPTKGEAKPPCDTVGGWVGPCAGSQAQPNRREKHHWGREGAMLCQSEKADGPGLEHGHQENQDKDVHSIGPEEARRGVLGRDGQSRWCGRVGEGLLGQETSNAPPSPCTPTPWDKSGRQAGRQSQLRGSG